LSKSRRTRAQTDGITLRLERDVLDALKREASDKQISTNTLASQIFRQHLDWHTNAAKAGFITVRKGALVKLLNKVSDEEIADIAKYVAETESEDFVLLLRNEYSLESAMNVITTWLKVSGYSYKHKANLGKHSYVIQHDLGRKWSIYLSEIYKYILTQFGQVVIRSNITANTVHIEFEER
jgi:hypothetical protein